MQEFHLNGKEYIELNKLLKLTRLVSTGGEANIYIDNGEVMVNDVVETRRRNKLRAGDVVKFQTHEIIILWKNWQKVWATQKAEKAEKAEKEKNKFTNINSSFLITLITNTRGPESEFSEF